MSSNSEYPWLTYTVVRVQLNHTKPTSCMHILVVQLQTSHAIMDAETVFRGVCSSWKTPVVLDCDYGTVFAPSFYTLNSPSDVFRLEKRCLKPIDTIVHRSQTQAFARILSFSARKRSISSNSWAYLAHKSNSGASVAQNLGDRNRGDYGITKSPQSKIHCGG